MRHPLIRILVALLIGVCTPLCCCQAMALARTACESTLDPQEKSAACCQSCHAQPSSNEESAPEDHEGSLPRDCPSCPSCQGASDEAALKVEAKFSTLDQELNAIATIAFLVLSDLPMPDPAMIAGLPSWRGDRLFIKANREALRWFCALNI